MIEQQLTLIDRAYMEPQDHTTQVSRIPGIDAPCLCPLTGVERIDQECLWPYCDWPRHLTEQEDEA